MHGTLLRMLLYMGVTKHLCIQRIVFLIQREALDNLKRHY